MQITLPISTLDIDLVANYEEGFVLAVTSTPINVAFTLSKDGGTPQTLQTPFSQTLLGGQYTIVMPTSVGSYRFVKWNDENTSPTRTETLNKNSSAVAIYELGVLEAGFPWWVIVIGGGVAAAGVYLASRKKKG